MRDDELTAAIEEVRARVRAQHPNGSLGLKDVVAADLMPLVHARDAAEAKVAAIGSVNPRPPGLKNSIAQWFKRKVARALDWHVREQIEFNRATMRCVQATIEALSETNRAMAALVSHHHGLRDELLSVDRARREETLSEITGVREEIQRLRGEMDAWYRAAEALHREADELKDVRAHWAEWRVGFEERRNASEIHLLRTVSELQGAFQHRVTLLDQAHRESLRLQHKEFIAEIARAHNEIQKRLWEDLEVIRRRYESQIHYELKLIRQKASVAAFATPQSTAGAQAEAANIPLDWIRFAENFRGSEEAIRKRQKGYVARFENLSPILDIGCGRGEFLEAARDGGLTAEGIDLSEECVAWCRSKGLNAKKADVYEYLEALPDRSLGGIYCAQVVEHLDPLRLPGLINLMAQKIRTDGLVMIETPNPECLAIFSSHFYIDPTHARPVPHPLLGFYMEEAGFGALELQRLSPAIEEAPELADLPAAFREKFFGGLDYVLFGRKL